MNNDIKSRIARECYYEYRSRLFILNKYPYCLSVDEVYDFFKHWFPNWSVYRIIGSPSVKVDKLIAKIRREMVSLKRIYKIEYLTIAKKFEVSYFKRHYNRTGCIYID